MQPSRAFSFRDAETTSALHSTKVPWWVRVFGWLGHVDAEDPARDADLRRRQADAAGAHAHGRHQVGRQPDDVVGGRVDLAPPPC